MVITGYLRLCYCKDKRDCAVTTAHIYSLADLNHSKTKVMQSSKILGERRRILIVLIADKPFMQAIVGPCRALVGLDLLTHILLLHSLKMSGTGKAGQLSRNSLVDTTAASSKVIPLYLLVVKIVVKKNYISIIG